MGAPQASPGVLLALAALGSALLLARNHVFRPRAVPAHMLGHPLVYERGLLSGQTHDDLVALVKGMAEYPTNTADRNFYKTLNEHIGEVRLGPAGGQTGR